MQIALVVWYTKLNLYGGSLRLITESYVSLRFFSCEPLRRLMRNVNIPQYWSFLPVVLFFQSVFPQVFDSVAVTNDHFLLPFLFNARRI